MTVRAGADPALIRELAASRPLLSVVIPVRQEERHIRETVGAVLSQQVDAPFEVLVVDGRSSDRTREIVDRIASSDTRVRLLDNPGRIVPTAMNVGIREARGAFVVRVDGHCRIPPDYLQSVVNAFRETGADCVGGAMVAEGDTYWGRVIALATSTAFGMGGVRFHGRGGRRELDTVYLGAYPRAVLLDLGLYDETFVRNQDDELNYRLRARGGRVCFDPRIWAAYTCRSSLRKLASQYAQYGWWKVRLYRKHPRLLSLRHLVPSAFVLSLLAAVLFGAVGGGAAWWGLGLLATAYVVGGLVSAAASRVPPGLIPAVLLACLVLHTAYGVGFLAGLAAPGARRGRRETP